MLAITGDTSVSSVPVTVLLVPSPAIGGTSVTRHEHHVLPGAELLVQSWHARDASVASNSQH